ncbi:hypothetical protein GGI02_003657 [Coemansia sp. RSA 2322]|uniref:ribonuclease H n=1 Tax=Coemansia thaxteri TaxID=2663907 RepID=A0A9W8EKG8_9FUNG|nr:hypothetical protein H4R26_002096 [Coemansia thaxteri]KAJ2468590.1 hypothetical protein GGI02_003657 [Coemansia sp. RSA 2322]KAJ2479124.1 hypothetical protein EV174_004107 [Coemansia sp. RSA 2320]
MSVNVYTASSCIYPGTADASGGVGIYFGPSVRRNFAGRLPGKDQTSQRAELGAIKRALIILSNPKYAPRDKPLAYIYTRSKYAVGCATTWPLKWVRNGWRNNKGFAIANKDLIVDIITLLLLSPYQVRLVHVSRDSNDQYSKVAQEMAARAARRGC